LCWAETTRNEGEDREGQLETVKMERSGTVVAQRGVLKGISGSLDGKNNDEGRQTRGRQTEWCSMESDEAMAIE
jgi:hypothetical protein